MTKKQFENAIVLDKLIDAEEALYKAIKSSSDRVNVIIPNDNKLKSQILATTMMRIAELKGEFDAI